MSNGIDRIIELPDDPLGGALGGASGTKRFHVLFTGKTSSEWRPYTVFNEKIAGEIGRTLGLFCPEVLIEPFGGKLYFFSHWQETTESGTILPGGSSKALLEYFKKNPGYIHGMLIFDLYIGNNDRRTENIILRSDGKLALIDHGNALLYYRRDEVPTPNGIERLEKLENDLTVIFDRTPQFISELKEEEMIRHWTDRIKQIPDFFIQALVENLPEIENIDSTAREKTMEFLLKRRFYLYEQIMDNRGLFPGLHQKQEVDDNG